MLRSIVINSNLLLFVFLASFFSFPAQLRADENKENLVKSAFIVNFTKFVSWQGDHAIEKLQKIDICVMGDSEISTMGKVFSQAPSKTQLSLVSENNLANVASHCHILFISKSENNKFYEIYSALKNKPVLTISDDEELVEKGAIIGFSNLDGKIKIIINKRAATTAGLSIDSQLLEIAQKVIDK